MKTQAALALLFAGLVVVPLDANPSEAVFPGQEWETAAPEEAGLDEAVLEELAEHVGGRGCVIRHGRLVYGWGDIAEPGDVASALKPLLSTLLFFAIQDGLLGGPEALVSAHAPTLTELGPETDGHITWKHLAQQTSGYGLEEGPGEAYSYNDYALALYYDALMDAVFEAHGDEVLSRYLGEPLQFQDPYTFEAFGPDDRPGRLAISVRDFARFGQLILRQGQWEGEQLLASAYVEEMLGTILPAETPVTSGRETGMLDGQRTIGGSRTITEVGPGFYSYNWWRNGVDRDGNRLYVDGPEDLILAGGHGGRRNLFVFPSQDLIVVWNDSHIDDHDDSPGNPDTMSNQAVRLIMAAVSNDD